MIGSEKLFSMMSDVMVQIFQKILTGKFECISNLFFVIWQQIINTRLHMNNLPLCFSDVLSRQI